MAEKKTVKTFKLPEGRLINSSLFEMDSYVDPKTQEEGTPSYKIEVAFDPADVLGEGKIDGEVAAAIADAYGEPWFNRFFDPADREIISPFLNGDILARAREEKGKEGDAYKGKIVIRANTIFNKFGNKGAGGVQVYGPDVKEIDALQQNLIYPGCYVIIAATIHPWETNRKEKTAKFYLSAVQKTRDGEKLAKGMDYSTVFKPVGRTDAAPAGATQPTRTRTR